MTMRFRQADWSEPLIFELSKEEEWATGYQS